ncbi:hypothetical protein PMAYCL1PPCAC_23308, partial [Pristionchus mayeri]
MDFTGDSGMESGRISSLVRFLIVSSFVGSLDSSPRGCSISSSLLHIISLNCFEVLRLVLILHYVAVLEVAQSRTILFIRRFDISIRIFLASRHFLDFFRNFSIDVVPVEVLQCREHLEDLRPVIVSFLHTILEGVEDGERAETLERLQILEGRELVVRKHQFLQLRALLHEEFEAALELVLADVQYDKFGKSRKAFERLQPTVHHRKGVQRVEIFGQSFNLLALAIVEVQLVDLGRVALAKLDFETCFHS